MTRFALVSSLVALLLVCLDIVRHGKNYLWPTPEPFQLLLEDGANNFGVGFYYGLDYATVSVAYPNHTVLDIAKIEGDASYKHMMRAVYNPQVNGELGYDALCSRYGYNYHGWCLWKQYIPRWTAIANYRQVKVVPALAHMARALEGAAEERMGARISKARFITPFILSQEKKLEFAAACPSIDFKPLSYQSASMFAAIARGVGADDSLEEELVLTIENNEAHLTASIIEVDQGVFDTMRIMHNTSLGDNKELHSEGYDGAIHALKEAFRGLLRPDIRDPDAELGAKLTRLIYFGESRWSKLLVLEALWEVLGYQQTFNLWDADMGNGTFAASAGLARDDVVKRGLDGTGRQIEYVSCQGWGDYLRLEYPEIL